MKVTVIKDSVIYKGIIYKVNDTFDADDAIAISLEKRGYVTPAIEVVNIETVDDEVPSTGHLDTEDLENMTYQDLKKLASELGVSADGKKADLIERISAVEVEVPSDAVVEEEELPNTSMPE